MTDPMAIVPVVVIILGCVALFVFVMMLAIKWFHHKPCEHNWVFFRELTVVDPPNPPIAVIYMHHCSRCGSISKRRVSNHGN